MLTTVFLIFDKVENLQMQISVVTLTLILVLGSWYTWNASIILSIIIDTLSPNSIFKSSQ